MNKGIITTISFFLTATLLIVGVSVVNATNQKQQPVPVQNDALIQQMNERESAYRQLVVEANQRIETLNQQVLTLSAGAVPTAMNPVVYLAPDQAAQIALTAVNQEDSLVQLPELVVYEGIQSYEVKMTKGQLYIDASNGQVLFNSVPKRIDEIQAAEIAAEYLGGMDPRYAVVKVTTLNGNSIFQVNLNNYVIFMDPYGQIIKAQLYQYVQSSSITASDSSMSSGSSSNEEHEEEYEEEEEDDED